MTKHANERVVGIIQARTGSERFPRKVLARLGDRTLLQHVIERTLAAREIQGVMLATTISAADDALETLARTLDVDVYRGNEFDVLDRYYRAAAKAGADVIVRITADDPFKEPVIIDRIVRELKADTKLDYVSNTIERTFPLGLDAEAFRFHALARAWREAESTYDREHVTPFIWTNPGLFRILNVSHDRDLSALRWTIDYPEDLRFARAVYDELYKGHIFHMEEILDLLERQPELMSLNTR